MGVLFQKSDRQIQVEKIDLRNDRKNNIKIHNIIIRDLKKQIYY